MASLTHLVVLITWTKITLGPTRVCAELHLAISEREKGGDKTLEKMNVKVH